MNISLIKSIHLCDLSATKRLFSISICFGYRRIGFEINTWGIRIMLLLRELCIHK